MLSSGVNKKLVLILNKIGGLVILKHIFVKLFMAIDYIILSVTKIFSSQTLFQGKLWISG